MARTKDMTNGNPVKLILFFALPILAGNTLQQFYSLIDTLIIGQRAVNDDKVKKLFSAEPLGGAQV